MYIISQAQNKQPVRTSSRSFRAGCFRCSQLFVAACSGRFPCAHMWPGVLLMRLAGGTPKPTSLRLSMQEP